MKTPGITVETQDLLSMVHVVMWSLLLLQTPGSGVSTLVPVPLNSSVFLFVQFWDLNI